MFGYSGEEFCALPVAALLVPDDVPRHAEAFRRVVAGEHVLAERHFRRKDGSDFVGEVSACQISNKVVLGTIRDLTERKRAELHLKRLMAAIEQVAEIIVITDPAGIIEYANPVFEEVTGYSLSEVIGQNPKVLKSGVQDATFYRGMWETISGGGTFHGRVVNRRKDGRTYTADITISPVREASGRIVNFVAVQRDVSRELALELERSQAQKLESVGRLAAGIAHEINTPTQYVGDNIEFLQIAYDSLLPLARSVSELLEAGRSAPLPAELLSRTQDLLENTNLDYLVEQVPRALEQSMEGLGRITVIVQAMKEFSHPGSVEKTAVDINHCIRSTSAVSHNEWKYVADLELDLEDGLPNVLCLPGELNQAILNMIVNAAHAIGDVVGEEAERKGKITIRTRQDGAWIEIRVADTGTGIPEAIRPKIFDPFFTSKEVGRGTGQGLAIARSVIVDKHRGTLAVESEVGKGTTFIIRLPIDDLDRAGVARA